MFAFDPKRTSARHFRRTGLSRYDTLLSLGADMRRREFLGVLAGAAGLPLPLSAQQSGMPVIGYLHSGRQTSQTANITAFRAGLKEAGLIEGQTVSIEFRWADDNFDRLPALAADFVDRKVNVIVVFGTAGIAAAKAATSTIPIVFFGGGDLVAAGLITSLARPGGNLTGIGIFGRELNPKRLELLSELIPKAEMIALLLNPNRSDTELLLRDMQEAARIINRQLRILKASTDSEIDAAFVTLAQSRRDGLDFCNGPLGVNPFRADPVAGVSLLSGVGARPPPDGV